MTKEEELMDYLRKKVFDPVLKSDRASQAMKRDILRTIGRMSRLSAKKMIQYYWSALAKEKSIALSKRLKAEGFPRFEDVLEEFRDRFNADWLKS